MKTILIITLLTIDTILIGFNLKQNSIEIKNKFIVLLSLISCLFVYIFKIIYDTIYPLLNPFILGYFFVFLAVLYLVKIILNKLQKKEQTFDFNKNQKINTFETIILSLFISFDNACFLSIHLETFFYIIYLFFINILFIKIGIEMKRKVKNESILEFIPIFVFLYLGLSFLFT